MFNEGHKATILVRKGSGCAQYKAYYLKLTLDDARSKMEDWRKYYNEVRPHAARRPAVAAGPQVEETSLWIGPLKGTRGLHRMAIFVSEASGYRVQPIPMKLLTFEVFWPGL
jgi:Integrase core domain